MGLNALATLTTLAIAAGTAIGCAGAAPARDTTDGPCLGANDAAVLAADTTIASGGGKLLHPLRNFAVAYPEWERKQRVAGRVVMSFVLDSTGRVPRSGARVESSDRPAFARAVCQMLGKVSFAPITFGGTPRSVLIVRTAFVFDGRSGVRAGVE